MAGNHNNAASKKHISSDEIVDPKGYVESLAQAAVVLAEKHGLIVSIEQRDDESVVSVRDARK